MVTLALTSNVYLNFKQINSAEEHCVLTLRMAAKESTAPGGRGGLQYATYQWKHNQRSLKLKGNKYKNIIMMRKHTDSNFLKLNSSAKSLVAVSNLKYDFCAPHLTKKICFRR